MIDFNKKRVLITRGLGFIGSNLARRLAELGANVTLVDSLIPEYGGNLFNITGIEDRVQVNISDVRDAHSMRYLVQGQDYLFNLAGQTSHMDSMTDPFTDMEINCHAQLKNDSLVVTGEGQVDEQTIYNKAPIGVAKAAKQAGVPVLAICALLGDGYEKVFEHGIDAVAAVSGKKGWCDTGKIVDEELLRIAAEDVFRQLKNSGVSSMHK